MTSKIVGRCSWAVAQKIIPNAHIMCQRAFYRPGYCFDLHDHDYAEFFYIEQGSAIHHLGRQHKQLEAGALVFIHPQTIHALAAPPRESLIFTNIAVSLDLFRNIEKRYADDPRWPWRQSADPQVFFPRGMNKDVLLQRCKDFEVPEVACDRLGAEAFLMDILYRMLRGYGEHSTYPDWLTQLDEELSDEAFLSEGPAEIAARYGMSREHLNRCIRNHCQVTASVFITNKRLEHACRLLRFSQESITDIALASGFPSHSHFYRSFKKERQCTPREYRLQGQGVFV